MKVAVYSDKPYQRPFLDEANALLDRTGGFIAR